MCIIYMAYTSDSHIEYELTDDDKLFEYIKEGNLKEIKKLVDEKKVDITSDIRDYDTTRLPVPFAAYYVTTRMPSDEHLSQERKRNIYKIISYLVANGATINDPFLDKDGIYIFELSSHFPELQKAIYVGKTERQKLLAGPKTRKRRKRNIGGKKQSSNKSRRSLCSKKQIKSRRRNIKHKRKKKH